VYVKVSVCAELAPTDVGDTVMVPEPSAAFVTVTVGEVLMADRAPSDDERSEVVKVLTPVAVGAVAPGPLEALDPYPMVHVAPPARVTPVSLMI
jgi:hypothetical protein